MGGRKGIEHPINRTNGLQSNGAPRFSPSKAFAASHLTRGEIEKLDTERVPRSQQLVVCRVDMYRCQFLEVLELADYPPGWPFVFMYAEDEINGVGRRKETKNQETAVSKKERHYIAPYFEDLRIIACSNGVFYLLSVFHHIKPSENCPPNPPWADTAGLADEAPDAPLNGTASCTALDRLVKSRPSSSSAPAEGSACAPTEGIAAASHSRKHLGGMTGG